MALRPHFAPGVLLATLVLLAHAPAAFSDIYQWTDEKGGVVYSNIRPRDTSKARNFKVVMEEQAAPASVSTVRSPPPDYAAQEAALAAQAEAMRHEEELRQRVANLEGQLAAIQYAAAPAQEPYASAAYDYPSGYAYPSLSYGVVVLPRFRSPGLRPALAPRSVPFHGVVHGGSVRGGSPHGGGRRR